MKLCVDASNIRQGGGVTHLVELLNSFRPSVHGFECVAVFAPNATLNRIKTRDYILKKHSVFFEYGFLLRMIWQWVFLKKYIKFEKYDVLFVPGGSDVSGFSPVVSMSQNLLPFDWQQIKSYRFTLFTAKLLLLRFAQSRTFLRSDGVVFLTEYARSVVQMSVKLDVDKTTIIPHGVDQRFENAPKKQQKIDCYTQKNPYSILYVSTIDVYKNQKYVVSAVADIRKLGVPVDLKLIGAAREPAFSQLKKQLQNIDNDGEFIHYLGEVDFSELHKYYAESDLMVFASSCENMPIILIEAMVAGLPIACSNKSPMPEILGDAGVYFNPANVDEIVDSLMKFISSTELRFNKAQLSYGIASQYTWARCADKTFQYLQSLSNSR